MNFLNIVNELSVMTDTDLKLTILCGVLNVGEFDRMAAPIMERDAKSPSHCEFSSQVVCLSARITIAQNELKRVFEEIADREAGDLFIEGDTVDLDIEDTEHYCDNPWDELIDDIDMVQQLENANR